MPPSYEFQTPEERATLEPNRWGPDRAVDRLSDEEAYSLINTLVSSSERGRDPTWLSLQRLWFQNIAYFIGLANQTYGQPPLLDFDLWRDYVQPAYSANHIGRIVWGEVARLSAARPNMEVVPNSTDQADELGARVAQQHAEFYYDHLELAEKRTDLANWMVNAGCGFLYAAWDKTKGRKRREYLNPLDGSVMPASAIDQPMREMLENYRAFRDVYDGDFDVEVVSPFQVRVPLGPTRLESMPWVVVTRLVTYDWLWEHYPKQAKNLHVSQSQAGLDTLYWRRLASLVGSVGSNLPVRGGPWVEGIELHELWIPAKGRFRKGARIVAAQGVLLENGVNPFEEPGVIHGNSFLHWNPLFMFPYRRVPGRFWPKSLTEDLIGPQEDYNVARQQLITQRDVLSKPQWLSSRQSKLGPTQNDTGTVWEYDHIGGPPPTLVSPPPLSQAHVQTKNDAIHDMQVISAQSDVTQAQVPTGVRSGVAIRALQEKDAMVLGPIISGMEASFRAFMQHLLEITVAWVKTPRLIEVYGESRQADVHWFQGSDLNGNTRIRIAPASMMPKSKAFQQQTLLDAIQIGVLDPTDPEIQRHALKVLEIGGLERMFLELDLDRRRAAIENEMFLRPDETQDYPFPEVDEYDNHELHVTEHLAFRKTDAFERMPEMRKMAFDAHLAHHLRYMSQAVEAQIAMSAATPPQPSQPRPVGEASQPRQPEVGSQTTQPEA